MYRAEDVRYVQYKLERMVLYSKEVSPVRSGYITCSLGNRRVGVCAALRSELNQIRRPQQQQAKKNFGGGTMMMLYNTSTSTRLVLVLPKNF